jgi:hypothetical protein
VSAIIATAFLPKSGMDDHHDQPIWPMLQGAANYAWNLVEEAWSMIWRPAVGSHGFTAKSQVEHHHQAAKGEMREVDRASANEQHITSAIASAKTLQER